MDTQTEKLWRRWRAGRDRQAFEDLVQPHLRYALDFATRSGLRWPDAEDALQDVLVRLAREASDEPVRVGVRSWLARSLRTQASTVRRSRKRRRGREERSARPHAQPAPTASLETREEVERALENLDSKEREAIVLRYLHDLEYREIGYVLNVSENAARIRVHRGIKRLRALLGGHAAALLAALALPPPSAQAALVSGAVAAATQPTGTLLAGVFAVKTSTKIAGAAALASAVTAVGLFATDVVFVDPTPPQRGDAVRAVAPDRVAPRRSDPLESLGATTEEVAFLRETLVKERTRREAARIRPVDSGLDVLRRVVENGADPAPVLADWNAFRSHVRPTATSPLRVGEGDPLDADAVAGRDVIELGPGTFRWEKSPWVHVDTDIASLEIRGAGKDRTTVVCDTPLVVAGKRIEHLVARDLTFVANAPPERSDQFLAAFGRVGVLLENIRLEGWDDSRGYAAPLGVSGGAYIGCRNVEFAGEHGPTTGGYGLAIRGATVALFTGCTFQDMESAVRGRHEHAHVHFEGCTFERTALTTRGDAPGSIRVEGCTVRFGPDLLTDEERREKWAAKAPVALADTTFAPAAAECTLGDLLEVLRLAEARGPRVLGVQFLGRRDGMRFKYFIQSDEGRIDQKFVRVGAGTLEDIESDRSGAAGVLSADAVADVRPLSDLVARADIPATMAIEQLWYGWSPLPVRSDDGGRVVVVLVGAGSPPPYIIDTRDGELLRRP